MTPVADTTSPQPAIEGCLDACRRCELLVDCVTGDGRPAASGAYAAIGPHLRHCLDHFECLLRGLAGGLVDYDARDRQARLETDPAQFRRAMASIHQRLRAIDPGSCVRTLQVRQAAALDVPAVTIDSNLERELAFLSGHTIHHLAIMKLLAEAHGVSVPDRLDVAFSTEAHQKQVEASELSRAG